MRKFPEPREDELAIGMVTVTFALPCYGVEPGFMIHHLYHGRGSGTEAVGAVVNRLVDQLNVHKISSMSDSQNVPCIAYLEHRPAGALAEDRVHPNQTGHMVIARAFLAAVGT